MEMQDLQSSFAAVERRLRPLGHHHHHPQVLKCPRCESTNTKFCYYNNYNLSQPRHFCKGCRRYWTKGGVLRNVPVGGGCRKNKRASSNSKANKPPPPPASSEAPGEVEKAAGSSPPTERKSSSHSSSESSSLTAPAATETVSATTAVAGAAGLLNIREYEQHLLANPIPGGASLHAPPGTGNGLVTATAEPIGCGGLDFSGQPGQDTCRWQSTDHHSLGGMFDQTVQVDLSGMGGGGGYGPSDWQVKDHHHQGVYDVPTTVDQAYWSQDSQIQWTDRDQGQQYSEPLPPLNLSQFLF